MLKMFSEVRRLQVSTGTMHHLLECLSCNCMLLPAATNISTAEIWHCKAVSRLVHSDVTPAAVLAITAQGPGAYRHASDMLTSMG